MYLCFGFVYAVLFCFVLRKRIRSVMNRERDLIKMYIKFSFKQREVLNNNKSILTPNSSFYSVEEGEMPSYMLESRVC